MDVLPEIKNWGEGKYSFFVGRQRYTLTTQLDEERVISVVKNVQAAVSQYPSSLCQDERLFLALMSLSFRLEELHRKTDAMVSRFSEEEHKQ